MRNSALEYTGSNYRGLSLLDYKMEEKDNRLRERSRSLSLTAGTERAEALVSLALTMNKLKEFCLNWRHHLGEVLISIGAIFLFDKFLFSSSFPVFFGFRIGSSILVIIIILGIFLLATRRRKYGSES